MRSSLVSQPWLWASAGTPLISEPNSFSALCRRSSAGGRQVRRRARTAGAAAWMSSPAYRSASTTLAACRLAKAPQMERLRKWASWPVPPWGSGAPAAWGVWASWAWRSPAARRAAFRRFVAASRAGQALAAALRGTVLVNAAKPVALVFQVFSLSEDDLLPPCPPPPAHDGPLFRDSLTMSERRHSFPDTGRLRSSGHLIARGTCRLDRTSCSVQHERVTPADWDSAIAADPRVIQALAAYLSQLQSSGGRAACILTHQRAWAAASSSAAARARLSLLLFPSRMPLWCLHQLHALGCDQGNRAVAH